MGTEIKNSYPEWEKFGDKFLRLLWNGFMLSRNLELVGICLPSLLFNLESSSTGDDYDDDLINFKLFNLRRNYL